VTLLVAFCFIGIILEKSYETEPALYLQELEKKKKEGEKVAEKSRKEEK
jgi:hypothetical protein